MPSNILKKRVFRLLMLLSLQNTAQSLNYSARQLTQLDQTVAKIGKFANYATIYDNTPLPEVAGCQGFPAKLLLAQIKPKLDTFSPQTNHFLPLTKLEPDSPLFNLQVPGDLPLKITVTPQSAELVLGSNSLTRSLLRGYGTNQATIRLESLRQMHAEAEMIVDGKFLTPQLFEFCLKLSENHQLKEQEKRSLSQLCASEKLPLPSAVELNMSADQHVLSTSLPLLYLASNACHIQPIRFFTEQFLRDDKAYNILRQGPVDNDAPIYLLSSPGLNFAYGAAKNGKIIVKEQDLTKTLIYNLWDVVLAAALKKKIKILFFSGIGMGAFLNESMLGEAISTELKHCYFEELITLLKTKYHNSFDRIYFNPGAPANHTILNQILQQQNFTNQELRVYAKDVMYAAIAAAMLGLRCGLLNPSDPDVIWAVYNIGEYVFQGHYAAEEHIVALSTAILGSFGINPQAYRRISTVKPAKSLKRPKSTLPSSSNQSAKTSTKPTVLERFSQALAKLFG